MSFAIARLVFLLRSSNAPPQPTYPGGDPFGARPTRRERGWGRVGLGVILIIAGLAAIGFGIAAAVGARDQIEADAVARGLSGEPNVHREPDQIRYISPAGFCHQICAMGFHGRHADGIDCRLLRRNG